MGPQVLSAWVGHWTGDGTGVTVILPPPGTVASGEVRGGAPATREFALLEPGRLVDRVDAVVLSGGSAYGLSAADGLMTLLRERGTGFPTPLGPVPIVVGMSIFDGSVAATPPGAAEGRAAAESALAGEPFTAGAVGAGAGATTGKWRGRLDPGGLGYATGTAGPATVAAIVVVNAWGDVLAPDGHPVHGGDPGTIPEVAPGFSNTTVAAAFPETPGFGNTTVAVLLTDARLGKGDCHLLAQSGHTGFARAIHPAHSRNDGDAVVALATGEAAGQAVGEVQLDLLRAVATETMAAAIRSAVRR